MRAAQRHRALVFQADRLRDVEPEAEPGQRLPVVVHLVERRGPQAVTETHVGVEVPRRLRAIGADDTLQVRRELVDGDRAALITLDLNVQSPRGQDEQQDRRGHREREAAAAVAEERHDCERGRRRDESAPALRGADKEHHRRDRGEDEAVPAGGFGYEPQERECDRHLHRDVGALVVEDRESAVGHLRAETGVGRFAEEQRGGAVDQEPRNETAVQMRPPDEHIAFRDDERRNWNRDQRVIPKRGVADGVHTVDAQVRDRARQPPRREEEQHLGRCAFLEPAAHVTGRDQQGEGADRDHDLAGEDRGVRDVDIREAAVEERIPGQERRQENRKHCQCALAAQERSELALGDRINRRVGRFDRCPGVHRGHRRLPESIAAWYASISDAIPCSGAYFDR